MDEQQYAAELQALTSRLTGLLPGVLDPEAWLIVQTVMHAAGLVSRGDLTAARDALSNTADRLEGQGAAVDAERKAETLRSMAALVAQAEERIRESGGAPHRDVLGSDYVYVPQARQKPPGR